MRRHTKAKKAVLVQVEENISDLTEELNKIFGKETIEKLVGNKSLLIGTKEMLDKEGF